MMLGQHLLQFVQMILAEVLAGDARRRAIAVRGGHAERLEQQRAEHGVEPLDPADAHAAQRVAVIGLAEGQIAGLFGPFASLGFGRGAGGEGSADCVAIRLRPFAAAQPSP